MIVLRHALKPALMPVVSLLGSICISSITAAVVTESVFALPGLGQLVVDGAINRDYTLVLGLVVLTTVAAVFSTCSSIWRMRGSIRASAIEDFANAYADPRANPRRSSNFLETIEPMNPPLPPLRPRPLPPRGARAVRSS